MESALTRTYLVTLIVNVICMKVLFQHLSAHMFCISESLMTKTKYLIISLTWISVGNFESEPQSYD